MRHEDALSALIQGFSFALETKLKASEAKYGWQGAWRRPGWSEQLNACLTEHVAKGDPLDVAAYCAFAWHHGWPIGAPPIPMILNCPQCGLQHIDEPSEGWENPPHRSHLCHACGCIWRPADVPTVGVAVIETIGKADTWTPAGAVLELGLDQILASE